MGANMLVSVMVSHLENRSYREGKTEACITPKTMRDNTNSSKLKLANVGVRKFTNEEPATLNSIRYLLPYFSAMIPPSKRS